MQQQSHTSTPASTVPLAAAYVGQAVLVLRRRAADEVSGRKCKALLHLADVLQHLVGAAEQLEAQ